MHENLKIVKETIYDVCGLQMRDFEKEAESREYEASRFTLNGLMMICRSSKITPKKSGQFVTFWKRNEHGTIEPFHEDDPVDFFIVNVQAQNKFGQFVFPTSVLIQKGILSTGKKEGKRAFRVYPGWDVPNSKQAEKTQMWQLDYFFDISGTIDCQQVNELYRAR